jgi:type IV secretory pathway protease TraF
MDVLGMYLLQRVSDELTIQRNGSFENQFISQIPDNAAAKAAHEGYLSSSKGIMHRIRRSCF